MRIRLRKIFLTHRVNPLLWLVPELPVRWVTPNSFTFSSCLPFLQVILTGPDPVMRRRSRECLVSISHHQGTDL